MYHFFTFSKVKKYFLLSFILILFVNNSFSEGTKQFMPNSTDRLWLEFNVFNNNHFGLYTATGKERIYIHMEAGEKMYWGLKINTTNYGGGVLRNPRRVSYRIKDTNGNVVYQHRLPISGENAYINNFNEATTGPNGIIINGTTISGGYTPLSLTATQTGDYYIEFQTWDDEINADGSAPWGVSESNDRFAIEFFDVTVTDASDNLVTNSGEPNIPAGRLWSKGWTFTNTSFEEYPVKADFYVFTADEFVNKVEFEMKPYSFRFAANSYGVQNSSTLNYIENAQSQDGDYTSTSDISEYRVFLNDPDRGVWVNTKLPPPKVKVWFEDQLIYDYDYDRIPQVADITVPEVSVEKNVPTCLYSSIAMFKIESNIDGFAAVLLDLDGNGYSTDGNDRCLYLDMKKGLNYVLWDCKKDNGDVAADGHFTASATFLGRGPAHFPLYDVETMSRVASSSIRPFNKLNPTIYWEDNDVTTWGDPNGGMVETAQQQLVIDKKVPRLWTFDTGEANNQYNGNRATFNTWYNAIDLGLSDIKFVISQSGTKCVNGDAPYVGNVFIEGPLNTDYDYSATDFDEKFFDLQGESLEEIRILSLPVYGTLTYNSNPVSINDVIAYANIADLTYTPPVNWSGKDYYRWEAKDEQDYWSNNTDTVFMIINTIPNISDISDYEICTNTTLSNIPFTVGDAETTPADLNIIPFSSDPLIIRNTDIVVGGSGANRTVTVTPRANVSGYAIVYLMVDDGLGQTIEDFAVTIGPSVDFTGDTTVCYGDPLELTAVEYGATYNWSFNGSTVSSGQSLNINPFQYADTGTYILTVTKGSCSASRNIQVSIAPLVTFTGDQNVCVGEPISLSADETVADYIWRKGGTQVATSKVFSIASASLSDAGTYSLEVTKEGCNNTSPDFTISVIGAPSTNLTLAGDDVSEGWDATVTVSSSENGITYNAYINDNLVASGAGNGSDLDITIPAADLSVGDNTVVVKAENTNCELELDNSTTVVVRRQNVTINPTSGLTTSETGTSDSYTVVLDAEPSSNVVINLSSDDTSEGTVSPTSLTFTATNWNTAQTVTVTGVNDNIDDDNVIYHIIAADAISSDPAYSGMNIDTVEVINNDDSDQAGITVSALSNNTAESGTNASFTIRLNSEPTSNVTIALSSDDTSEGTVSPASLIFTPSNWNTIQTVTITAVDDYLDDGDISYNIITSNASSSDSKYNGMPVPDVSVINIDNDNAGVNISSVTGTISESGGHGTFTITLTSEPTDDVTIGLTCSDPSEGTLSISSAVLNSINWNTGVDVTVTGVDDDVDDGDVTFTIITGDASSADNDYNGMPVGDVTVINVDDDVAGFTVSNISGHTSETGGTATFTIRLNSQPTDNVTVSFTSSDSGEGVASPASFTFTSANWDNTQTITVTGQDDDIDDDNQTYTIVNTVASTSDALYASLDPDDVTVINDDDADAAGITVSAISGHTNEGGQTATFTIVLNSEPTSNVTIGLSSSATDEVTVAVSSVTFTSANWSTAQTITVTGVDDDIVDGAQTATIITALAVSSDTKYNNINPNDVTVINDDQGDVAGVTVSPTSGLQTAENGATATFTIVLTSEPTADVTINLSSSDTGEGTVSPASVTFTSANWNNTQTITVTGVNDAVADGDQSYTIITSAANSSDGVYNGMAVDDVSVTNVDGDIANINVSTISRHTNEDGQTATFTIVLTSQPTANVTIGLSSSDATEGTVSPASVTFTSGNWNTTQTVTVTGVDDNIDDGDVTYTIITAAATSTDGNYGGMNADDVTVVNDDNGDAAGITVTPTSGLTTTEAGGNETFTIVLTSEPTADVTIGLSSSDATEGAVSPASVTFTSANWNTAQTVTVTGVDDNVDDGDITYSIITAAATSTDGNYGGMNANDVSVTNTDDDNAGITVTPISGLTTTEAGGTATFTIVLTSEPTADVTIGLSSSDATEGTVSPANVTFTSGNWNTAQTVTVTGVDDDVDDGNVSYSIITAQASSSDAEYSGINASNVLVTNTDDDNAGIIVSTISRHTNEDGQTATFTIVLNSEPTANVVIGLVTSDASEGELAVNTVSFTPTNWNIAQTVTVTGVDDDVDDGNVAYTIITTLNSSADPNYSAIDPDDVAVINDDNGDIAGITVSNTTGLQTTEAGGTALFTVVLNSKPTAPVSINLSSDDTSEGTITTTTVTFTPANWNTPQTITVVGVDDDVDDDNIIYHVITSVASSSDVKYNGIDPDNVEMINIDDDDAGVTVSTISGHTTEAGGTATFSIVLNSEPVNQVTINLSSSDTGEGTIDKSSVVFDASNWDTPQVVTITGQDDNIDDGAQYYTIVTSHVHSIDSKYSNRSVPDVDVVNDDDDNAGVTVNPTSGLITAESGTTQSFTVVLNSEPVADVVISITSSDPTEGNVSVSSLTFTSANWNNAQQVTVTGVNDNIDDGDIAYTVNVDISSTTDTKYASLSVDDVSLINTDDDNAGITVNPTSGLTTTESGTTQSFTIVLNSEPTADVTISITSSDVSEGTVSSSSLTFTSANWNNAQTVIVTGVDDDIDDGDIAYTIQTGNAVSVDAVYNNMNVADVSLTNTNDDAVGFTVTETGGTTVTSEFGTTDVFSVVLNAAPASSSVEFTITNGDNTEGNIDKTVLTFDATNWNVPQDITVTGVDDAVADGAQTYQITISVNDANSDDQFDTLSDQTVSVTNSDNDTPGITLTSINGNTVEDGTKASFTIRLNTQPTASVSIDLSSNDVTEGTPDINSVTFTAGNWNIAQTVYVSGVDDDIDDGDITYLIVTAPAVSADGNYNNMNADDISVTNIDNDTSRVNVSVISGNTIEDGTQATFSIVLNCEPTANVTINLSSDNTAEATVSPVSVTFTSGNWNTAQTVTVTGVDDDIDDGDQTVTIITSDAVSSDANYNNMVVDDVQLINIDNDTAKVLLSAISNHTSELGVVATFTVQLQTEPVNDVTVVLASDDESEGVIDISTLTFTSSDWNTAQTVTVTGIDDNINDGDITYHIYVDTVISVDTNYNGITCDTVTVVNDDDGTPVAVNDTGVTDEDVSISIDVLANDSGLDKGGILITITTEPQHGTVVVNSDNTVSYRPETDYYGTDSYIYQICNVDDECASAAVDITINPVNDYIPLPVDDSRATSRNQAVDIDVLFNDKGLNDGGIVLTTISTPSHGSVIVNSDNTITYTPTTDYLGFDSFDYQVCDRDNDCGTATVTVNVKEHNYVPIAVDDYASTTVNKEVVVNVLSNDRDLNDGVKDVSIYVEPVNGAVKVNNNNTITYVPNTDFIGNDSLTYYVTDNDGDYGLAKVYITVSDNTNHIPVAVDDSRGTSKNTPVVVNVLINDTGLEDGGIAVTTLSVPVNGSIIVNADNTITYTPNTDYLGTDTFKYKITDKDGDADSALVTITVKEHNVNPVAVNDKATTYMNTGVVVNVLNNDTGLEDGLKDVKIYVSPFNGTAVVNADNTVTYTPANWYLGVDSLRYIIIDVDGDYSIATLVIDVIEKPNFIPVAVDDGRGTVVNIPVNVDVLINDKGLEDGGIVVSSVTNPTNGSIIVNADNTITYTPNTDYLGNDTFEYRVADKDGDADTAMVTIHVKLTNDVPVAINDTAKTYMSTPIRINILSNDKGLSDGVDSVWIYAQPLNGNVVVNADKTITYTPANWYIGVDSLKYLVQDTDGDYGIATVIISIDNKPNRIPVAVADRRATVINTPVNVDVLINDTGLEDGGITVSSVSNPVNGSITVNADNTITYTPNNDYLGYDSFEYRVEDINGDADTAMVTINVKLTNEVPVAVNDTASTFMDTPITVNVLNNDSKLDDGVGSVKIFSNPLNGAVVVNSDNTITYTPVNWYLGVDSLKYMVEDVDGDYDTATVIINITQKPNSIPDAIDDRRATAINTPANINVLINDLNLDDGGIVVTVELQPFNGAVIVNPDNTVIYTPNNGYLGYDSFKYKVTDIDGDSDTATVTVHVKPINYLPLAVNDTVSTYINTAITVNLLKNDKGLEDGLESLTVYNNPVNGTVIVNSDNTITYTPANWYFGVDSLSYMITDNDGDLSIAWVIINIAKNKPNHIPVAVDDGRGTVINTPVRVDVLINDTGLEDGGLQLSVTQNPAHGTISINSDNTINYTPENDYLGNDIFYYRIADVDDDADTAMVTIHVKLTNDVPVAENDTANTEMNTAVTVNVLANDRGLSDGIGEMFIYKQPANGTVVINTDNTVTYTPFDWYSGSDDFEYMITDVDGDYSIANVHINISPYHQNNIPVAEDDRRATSINTPVTVDVLFNDKGLEDGGIIITPIITNKSSVIVNSDNTVTFTPDNNFLGIYTFDYRVADIDGDADTAKVTINVKETNEVPVAVNDTVDTYVNTPITVNVIANDRGLEDGFESMSIHLYPANGSVVVNGNNTLTYTPANWYVGVDSLQYVITDVDGDYGVATLIIHISEKPNEIPVAVDDHRATAINTSVNINVLFNDSGLGDGGITVDIVSNPTTGSVIVNNDNTVTFTPQTDYLGVVTFKYAVTDKDGDSDMATVTVNVKETNAIPDAKDDFVNTYMNTAVTVNVLANDEGLEDGFESIAIYIQPLFGTVIINNNNTFTYTPANWYLGNDSLQYVIVDTDGDISVATVYITVSERPNAIPDAIDDRRATAINTPVVVDVLFNDTGLDDGGIVVDAEENPVHGSINVNQDNTITYTPATDYLGFDTFKYKVTDIDGDSDIATVTINVKETNSIPYAVDDTAVTSINKPVLVNILANDTALIDEPITVSIITEPVNGQVEVNYDNSITYTPLDWYVGSDELTYAVFDVDGDYSVAKVLITVREENTAPVANKDSIHITKGDDSVLGNIVANDTDADGDNVYIINLGGQLVDTVNLVSDYGVLDWRRYGTVIFHLNNDNQQVKELQTGDRLSFEYDYIISDGGEETSTSTLKIIIEGKDDIIINDPPVANNDQFTITEGEEDVSGNLLLNDTDPDEDPLIVTQINNATDTTTIVSGNYGKVVWKADGRFRYILDQTSKEVFNLIEGQTLVDNFTYHISDPKGGVANAKFTVTIVGINNSDDLIAVKAFSPNGDGVNDFFVIKNIEKYPVNELFVYNRWGTKVHYQRSYNNTWGGLARQNGKLLPVGTYYYVLILNNNKKNIIKGYVYIKY